MKEAQSRMYQVTLAGQIDMIHHRDNIEWGESLKAWREDPTNREKSVRGDDRSPAWTWLGSLYHDEEKITIPADNIRRSIMEGGAQHLVPGGRSGKTFKAQTQSGLTIMDEHWPLLILDKPVPVKPLFKLVGNNDFEAHQEAARKAGFLLFVKRVVIGQSKHIRVRPRFRGWSASGMIQVRDEAITTDVLRSILSMAGANKGIGDWRPSSKTPGPFGRFSAEVKEVK